MKRKNNDRCGRRADRCDLSGNAGVLWEISRTWDSVSPVSYETLQEHWDSILPFLRYSTSVRRSSGWCLVHASCH